MASGRRAASFDDCVAFKSLIGSWYLGVSDEDWSRVRRALLEKHGFVECGLPPIAEGKKAEGLEASVRFWK